MYKYKIGYGTYEESDYTELEHKNKFTKEQLNQLMAKCIAECIPKACYAHCYQDVHYGVIRKLVDTYGFQHVEYEEKWIVFGWGSLFEERNFNEVKDESLEYVKKYLKEYGYGTWDDPMHATESWTYKKMSRLVPRHHARWTFPSLYGKKEICEIERW